MKRKLKHDWKWKGSSMKKITIDIPDHVSFGDLNVTRTEAGLSLNWDIIHEIYKSSFISLEEFQRIIEGNIVAFILDWYTLHRYQSGETHQVMESLIQEIEFDKQVMKNFPDAIKAV